VYIFSSSKKRTFVSYNNGPDVVAALIGYSNTNPNPDVNLIAIIRACESLNESPSNYIELCIWTSRTEK